VNREGLVRLIGFAKNPFDAQKAWSDTLQHLGSREQAELFTLLVLKNWGRLESRLLLQGLFHPLCWPSWSEDTMLFPVTPSSMHHWKIDVFSSLYQFSSHVVNDPAKRFSNVYWIAPSNILLRLENQ